MLVRNIGAPRLVASPSHSFWSEEVATGDTIDVPDEYGIEACRQTEVWEPGDDAAHGLFAAAEKAREALEVEADKAEHPDETARERKARLKAEAEAATAAEQEVN